MAAECGGGLLRWRRAATVARDAWGVRWRRSSGDRWCDQQQRWRWRTAVAANCGGGRLQRYGVVADCGGGGVLRGRRAAWAATGACGVARVGGEAVADGEMIMITLL